MVKLSVCENKEAVAKEAAGIIAELIRSKPAAVLGLATGSTPVGTYAELSKMHRDAELSFSRVMTFNLDEYWGLDGSHDQSYRHFMNTHLFDKVDVQPWNTNVLNGVAQDADLECQAFETKILAVGGVDLWLLGVGGNGHIAFNEPGSPVDSRTRLVDLAEDTIAANSDGRFFSDPKDVPRRALSVGIGTIRDARRILLLASGPGKAEPIAAAVEGPFSTDCPASLLQDHPDCTFVLDREAASKLKNG